MLDDVRFVFDFRFGFGTKNRVYNNGLDAYGRTIQIISQHAHKFTFVLSQSRIYILQIQQGHQMV